LESCIHLQLSLLLWRCGILGTEKTLDGLGMNESLKSWE
jgi:hypothetical protein